MGPIFGPEVWVKSFSSMRTTTGDECLVVSKIGSDNARRSVGNGGFRPGTGEDIAEETDRSDGTDFFEKR